MKSIKDGIPLRIWDIIGSQGFLITNYQSELDEYFVQDQDIVIYNDIGDLIEKINYYHKNEDLRKKIVHNGYEKVKKEHNFENRIRMILSTVEGN